MLSVKIKIKFLSNSCRYFKFNQVWHRSKQKVERLCCANLPNGEDLSVKILRIWNSGFCYCCCASLPNEGGVAFICLNTKHLKSWLFLLISYQTGSRLYFCIMLVGFYYNTKRISLLLKIFLWLVMIDSWS